MAASSGEDCGARFRWGWAMRRCGVTGTGLDMYRPLVGFEGPQGHLLLLLLLLHLLLRLLLLRLLLRLG